MNGFQKFLRVVDGHEKYNIHVRFAEAQPNSLQLEGGKNDIFVPSREAARVKISHFCLPKAEVNEVGPRQNERECYSCFYTLYGSWVRILFLPCKWSSTGQE